MRRFFSIVLVLAALVSLTQTAWAAEGNVTYQSNAHRFIFEPGSRYSPTDLFPNFKDVMPGDRLTQQIRLYNDKRNNVKIRVYLRSLGAADAESQDFLSQLHLSVVKLTDTVYFDAAADQPAQLRDWVYLGTLYSSGECDLQVVLDVPEAMDNDYQERIGVLDWEFMIEELPISPDDPPPKTGDTFPLAAARCTAAGSGMALLLLLLLRRKHRKS